jgi:SAM-dependent methyltransferase
MQPETKSIQSAGYALMDEVEEMLLSNCVVQGMSRIAEGLKGIRSRHTSDEWLTFAQTGFLKHSLSQIIYQDPFTRHSFEKPRGYAGDAELLDYIYGFRFPPANSTVLGQEILKYSADMAAMPQSVRARRDILAQTIDCLADENSHPVRVLSIACGHLREAKKSEAFLAGQIGEFIALDQDLQSLELIKQEQSSYPIQTIHSSITALIRNKLTFENLDLVYAAGLYDYLSQSFATRLTKIMFDMLRPGGKLLVANFIPDHREVGYMETFMQWHLIYSGSYSDEVQ